MAYPVGHIIRSEKDGQYYKKVKPADSLDSWELVADMEPAFQRNESGSMYDLAPPTTLQSIGAGANDIFAGGQQLFHRLFSSDDKVAEFEGQQNRNMNTYEEGRGPDAGFDWPRMGGAIAAGAPLMALPGGGATLAGRAGLGMLAGGVGAGTMYTPTDGTDFLSGKAAQVATGAVLGGVLNAASPGVIKAAMKLPKEAAKIYRRLSPKVKNQMLGRLSESLKRAGVAWDDIGDDVQTRMLKEATESVDATGDFSPDEILRKENILRFFDDETTRPTSAQVTRNPAQWQAERELAKVDEVGAPLRNRYVAQNQSMMDTAEGIAAKIAPEEDAVAVGNRFRDVARSRAKSTQRRVSAAYRRATMNAQVDDLINSPGKLDDQIIDVLDMGEDVLPSNVINRLKEFLPTASSKGDFVAPVRNMTIKEVHQALKLVNRQLEKRGGESAKFLQDAGNILRGALDDTGKAGGKAAQSLRDASALAAKRFGLISGSGRDKTQIVKSIIDGKTTPDKLVQKLMTGSLDDAAQVKRFLTQLDDEAFPRIPKQEATDVWNSMRAAIIRQLNKKAGYSPDPSSGQFSGVTFQKAWRAIPKPKRDILFSADEQELIESFAKAVHDMTREPAFSAVNQSNTGAQMANLLRRVLQTQGLSDLVDGAAMATRNATGAKAVNRALAGRAGTDAQRLMREQFLQRMLGNYPGWAGGVAAGQGVRQ